MESTGVGTPPSIKKDMRESESRQKVPRRASFNGKKDGDLVMRYCRFGNHGLLDIMVKKVTQWVKQAVSHGQTSCVSWSTSCQLFIYGDNKTKQLSHPNFLRLKTEKEVEKEKVKKCVSFHGLRARSARAAKNFVLLWRGAHSSNAHCALSHFFIFTMAKNKNDQKSDHGQKIELAFLDKKMFWKCYFTLHCRHEGVFSTVEAR